MKTWHSDFLRMPMNINTESSPSSPAPIEARVQTKKLRPQRSKEEWFSLLDM
jgi:hypothetical protein